MTTSTADLVRLTVAALRSANTDVGDQVVSPGDWPTKTGKFPLILVQGVRELKESLGRAGLNFTVTSIVRITARVAAAAAAEDQGGLHAEQKLWRLQRQIEIAVINADTIMPLLQQISEIRSQMASDASGGAQVAELVMEVAMEYYQGPEDFYPTAEAPIAGFDVQTPFTDPNFDADLTAAGG